ncbi:type I-B CRISPR-associated protein Cas5 [candidate division TA06 bacterium]|uniref:Type I-B CRISPR-associated protein Cas5 n=1 Tax=candidate division TA06 bacterium TaxID=2250710 RepID=A0A660SLY1_UNCT6|nr:MAG: type I-B CRISPR-associated protein Cas5 [candidate division TA06 bacterium]
MSKKTICIELFQPFAQYRNPFTFYYAQTYPLPPKSTIIGMLQNAVGDWYGYKRWYKNEKGEDKNLWWDNLKVSIHGGFESVFWNYQQLIKGNVTLKKFNDVITLWNQNLPLYNEGIRSQRSPVYQQELFNGHLYIFLKGDKNLIDEIENALKNPQKILYLGRSEDVIFIKNVHSEVNWEYREKEVKNFFRLEYPTYIKQDKFPIKNEKFPVYSIPIKVIFSNHGKPITNKSQISKHTERIPKFETVIYTGTDYIVSLQNSISLEYFKLADKTFKIPEGFGWI